VLDALGIDRAVLVGQDASGPDAVAYSIASPRRVARLVLLNTVFGHQPSLKWPEMTRLFADPQLTTLADDLVGDPSQLLWLLQRWGVQWQLDADDPEGIARNSILPQFYLGPSLAAEIAALFPNPSVHLLPGAGHYPQHDQPDTVAELLKEPRQPDRNPRQ